MMTRTRQTAAELAISDSGVLAGLCRFDATVVSTILVGLDTGSSDIDIVCSFQSIDDFVSAANSQCEHFSQFSLNRKQDVVIVRFVFAGFPFEIYACPLPVSEQAAYRHFRIMQRLVALGGELFQEKVVALKNSGLKTEPAIASTLGLTGDSSADLSTNLPTDPYAAVLELEGLSDEQLRELLIQG